MESLALALEQAFEKEKERKKKVETPSTSIKEFDASLLPPVLNPIVGRSPPKPHQNIFDEIDYAKVLEEQVQKTLKDRGL